MDRNSSQEGPAAPRWVDAATAGRFAGVTGKTIRRWADEGCISQAKLSRRCVRFDLESLSRFIESRTVKAIEEL